MSIREWIRNRIRDDQKWAELEEREARSEAVADGLVEELEKNGFGRIFTFEALDTHPPRRPLRPRTATPHGKDPRL